MVEELTEDTMGGNYRLKHQISCWYMIHTREHLRPNEVVCW